MLNVLIVIRFAVALACERLQSVCVCTALVFFSRRILVSLRVLRTES